MYSMKPPAVFVSDRILDNKECMARLDSFMKATRAPTWKVVRDEDIPAMLEEPVWKRVEGKAGSRAKIYDPVYFFNTFRFDGDKKEVLRRIAEANPGFNVDRIPDYMLGYKHFVWFNSCQGADKAQMNPEHVCRPCWRLNISPGCPHECAYCGLTGFMVVGLNMSDYLQQLDALMTANPWQLTYLVDDISDVLVNEPELDLFSEMVRFFGRKNNRYLIAHTKSANVDFLHELPHNGNTIMCYSLSAETQSTQLEKVAGTTDERITAARKCQEWGMPVRFKFKPIIPVKNWRDEARDMLRKVFEQTQPDNLSMTVMMWMTFSEMASCIDLDMLDPKFVDAARKASDTEWKYKRLRPFPHELRREVYEFYHREIRALDKNVPLTLSTESAAMWQDLGGIFGVEPATYTCGCGPCAVPGLTKLSENAWKVAQYNVPAGREGAWSVR